MKQLQPRCKCGQVISFSVGQATARCPIDGCGMRWERGPEGYWAIGLNTVLFTPIFTKEKLNRYQKYMKRRKPKRRRARR